MPQAGPLARAACAPDKPLLPHARREFLRLAGPCRAGGSGSGVGRGQWSAVLEVAVQSLLRFVDGRKTPEPGPFIDS